MGFRLLMRLYVCLCIVQIKQFWIWIWIWTVLGSTCGSLGNYPYQTNIHPVVIFKASESQRTNLRYQMGPHLVAIMAAKWPESQAHLAANCLFKRVYWCLPHCWRRLLPRGLDVHVLALWFSLPSSPPYQHQGACCCGYVCPSVVPPMGRTSCYSAHWQYCYPRGY